MFSKKKTKTKTNNEIYKRSTTTKKTIESNYEKRRSDNWNVLTIKPWWGIPNSKGHWIRAHETELRRQPKCEMEQENRDKWMQWIAFNSLINLVTLMRQTVAMKLYVRICIFSTVSTYHFMWIANLRTSIIACITVACILRTSHAFVSFLISYLLFYIICCRPVHRDTFFMIPKIKNHDQMWNIKTN